MIIAVILIILFIIIITELASQQSDHKLQFAYKAKLDPKKTIKPNPKLDPKKLNRGSESVVSVGPTTGRTDGDLYIANPIAPVKDGNNKVVTGSIGVQFTQDGKTQLYFRHDLGKNSDFTLFKTCTGKKCTFVNNDKPVITSISTNVGPTINQVDTTKKYTLNNGQQVQFTSDGTPLFL